jgi:SAM-dependent methyltransferase
MGWEFRLGISTRGVVRVPDPDSFYYATMSYPTILSILRHLSLKPTDVFVDLGCGKGRVVCCASLFDVGEVVGVEQHAPLYAIATSNVRRARGTKAPVRILFGAAQDFDFTAGTVFYLFNPFGSETLRTVLSRIERTLSGRSSPVRIVYANPEHRSVLAECRWLEEYDSWDPAQQPGLEHTISFWKSKERALEPSLMERTQAARIRRRIGIDAAAPVAKH